jgi:hydrogenase expression/formation protein HypC
MCVAVPGLVVAIGESTPNSIPAQVYVINTRRDVDLVMVPHAAVGDYVVIHSGYALEIIPKERAIETMALFGIETAS